MHNRVTNSGIGSAGAEHSTLASLYRARGDWRATMDLLFAYYLNNGLYDSIRGALSGIGYEDDEIRPLRNPANRVVEFYAAKLWPGTLPAALPIELPDGANPSITDRIDDVWRWSNWSAKKTLFARWLAIFGNGFIKVAAERDERPDRRRGDGKVVLQVLDPRLVVDFDADDRDVLTWFRIDTPQQRRTEKGEVESYVVTEVWDLDADRMRVWEHQRGIGADMRHLPIPQTDVSIGERYDIDFLPIVHVKQRDVGDDWGAGAFVLELDKIDEANRQATRLHAMLFRNNRPVWAALANALDASGRPVPAPKLADDDNGEIELSGDKIMRLPGMSRLEALVPNINFAAHLDALEAHMQELQRDLPELAYYELRGRTDLSGVAVAMLLSDAVDRLLEARGNAEAGLIRAQQIALTVGQRMGLSGFGESEIGTYERGAFEHQFVQREALPLSEPQRMTVVQQGTAAGMALATAMRHAGYSEDAIEMALEDLSEEQARSRNEARAYLELQRDVAGNDVYPQGEEVGGNPWDVFRVDDEYCVYEVDDDGNRTGAAEGCYATRAEAERLLRALYANTGEEHR